jgi:ureidoacrylate peracid hydrolase
MPVTLLTREIEIEPQHAALLFIDVQNYSANPEAPRFKQLFPEQLESAYGFFFRTMHATAVPNMQRVQAACRRAGIEVIYTVIENLTKDGRDRSLDYKISGLDVPKGSWEARVLDAIAPSGDEIVLPKTSSSVFISTNIDYVLRNLGVRFLMIAGILTDQCVDSAVRDACDLGYLVTVITDACATHSEERHEWSLRNNRGYARQRTTDQIVGEIERLSGAAGR